MKGFTLGLAALAAVLNFLDNWSTWICLRDPVEVAKWGIVEVNVIAAWTFELMGLGWGLVFEYALTLVALAFIAKTAYLGHRTRLCILGVLCIMAGVATVNNFGVISELGLLAP